MPSRTDQFDLYIHMYIYNQIQYYIYIYILIYTSADPGRRQGGARQGREVLKNNNNNNNKKKKNKNKNKNFLEFQETCQAVFGCDLAAFRLVPVSIAFARVAKPASQKVQSSFSTGSAHLAACKMFLVQEFRRHVRQNKNKNKNKHTNATKRCVVRWLQAAV